MRRFPLAFLLVGVMSLLAAGGAVLGAFEAPTGVDLAVHNSAGQALLADRVVGAYTSSQLSGTVVTFSFAAPADVTATLVGTSGQVEERQKLTGSKAVQVLAPLRRLLSLKSFSRHGRYYDNVQTARHQVSQGGVISETDTTRVQLAGGYVVTVLERIELEEGSRHATITTDYRLSQVGGWTRPS